MANHKSAMKRNRQNEKRNIRNKSSKSKMATSIKALTKAVTEGNSDAVKEQLTSATSVIAKVSQKGVFHKNTAARKISRLTKAANKITSK